MSYIPDSKAQDPNSTSKISRIPDTISKNISGIPDLYSLAWPEPWALGKSDYCPPGGGLPLGILGGGVPTSSSDPDPISEQKM